MSLVCRVVGLSYILMKSDIIVFLLICIFYNDTTLQDICGTAPTSWTYELANNSLLWLSKMCWALTDISQISDRTGWTKRESGSWGSWPAVWYQWSGISESTHLILWVGRRAHLVWSLRLWRVLVWQLPPTHRAAYDTHTLLHYSTPPSPSYPLPLAIERFHTYHGWVINYNVDNNNHYINNKDAVFLVSCGHLWC